MYYLGYTPSRGCTLKMPYQNSCATSQFDSFSEKRNQASINVMKAFFFHIKGMLLGDGMFPSPYITAQ